MGCENDQGETKEDTHYAIAKELDDAIKANLTLTMHDNTRLTYAQAGNTIKMTYYAQKNGTEEVDANNSSTRVRSFSIHVKAGDNQNPVRSISVTGTRIATTCPPVRCGPIRTPSISTA